MKKKLDTSIITSELRGSSAFFPSYKKDNSPTSQNPAAIKKPTEVIKPEQTTHVNEGVPPPVPRTVPRPEPLIPKVKRPIKQRQPFDIYEDQYQSLKKIAESEKDFVNGRGMSQMVRDAIDNYLKNHGSPKK